VEIFTSDSEQTLSMKSLLINWQLRALFSVVLTENSQTKITYKTDKNSNMLVILSVLGVN
jgi:hypothetical protein